MDNRYTCEHMGKPKPGTKGTPVVHKNAEEPVGVMLRADCARRLAQDEDYVFPFEETLSGLKK